MEQHKEKTTPVERLREQVQMLLKSISTPEEMPAVVQED
jgi:hypothetical protein